MHKLQEQEISTQIDSGAAPRARSPVRIAAAAAVGLALLVWGCPALTDRAGGSVRRPG
jgi:hypothetical protein